VVLSLWGKERELRKFSDQIELGITQGWLHIQEPSTSDVRNLMTAVGGSFDLDQGEAETIVVAAEQAGRQTRLVIDEGEAFVFIQRALIGRGAAKNWTLNC
jgi:predicted nucleic acid-binding protein